MVANYEIDLQSSIYYLIPEGEYCSSCALDFLSTTSPTLFSQGTPLYWIPMAWTTKSQMFLLLHATAPPRRKCVIGMYAAWGPGTSAVFCDAAHIIPHSTGDEACQNFLPALLLGPNTIPSYSI